jgi:hypothetical protein
MAHVSTRGQAHTTGPSADVADMSGRIMRRRKPRRRVRARRRCATHSSLEHEQAHERARPPGCARVVAHLPRRVAHRGMVVCCMDAVGPAVVWTSTAHRQTCSPKNSTAPMRSASAEREPSGLRTLVRPAGIEEALLLGCNGQDAAAIRTSWGCCHGNDRAWGAATNKTARRSSSAA